jgi:hypothetical protein
VRTDGCQGYFDVGRHPFMHVVTNPSASGDPHVALPHVHRVASLVQRWLLGTHQGAIGPHQLDYDICRTSNPACSFSACDLVAPRRAQASTKQAGRLLACRPRSVGPR